LNADLKNKKTLQTFKGMLLINSVRIASVKRTLLSVSFKKSAQLGKSPSHLVLQLGNNKQRL